MASSGKGDALTARQRGVHSPASTGRAVAAPSIPSGSWPGFDRTSRNQCRGWVVGYRYSMRRDVTRSFAELAAAQLTYEEVGATRAEPLPSGYGHVHRDVSLGSGPEVFARAVAALFEWRMHQEAGLAVMSPEGPAAPGIVLVLRAGWGPLHLIIPCRVVYTVDEADRRGFAYGTLPGHPERGEEAFTVARSQRGDVRIRIRAFSRPASLLARAGGPVSRIVQQYATDRYIGAIQRLARGNTDPTSATS